MNIFVVVPLDWNLSKNKKFVGRTKKALNPLYKSAKKFIFWKVFQEVKKTGGEFAKDKTFLKIKVYKKGHVGDCINLIEGIADAIKEAINVDDRYFSVECDYSITDKQNEKITIEVTQ